MKQPVIFDCDGVLLDWELGFRQWMNRAHPSFRFSSDYPTSWDLSGWIGCSAEQAQDLIREFNQSELFGALLPMSCAARTLYEVARAGHPIYILTSCSSDQTVCDRRTENLADRFSTEIHRTICLDLGVSKLDTLNAFYTVFGKCIWIEDNYRNALAGVEAGHRSFFLRRAHNEDQWKKRTEGLNHLDRLSDLVSLI